MLKRGYRSLRLHLVLLLVLAFSAVYPSSAQTTSLTQIVKTLDGQISIRLPQGWMSRDAAASVFTSVLAVGDSATSLQAVIDSLSTTSTNTAPAMNAVIGIINPQLVSGLSSDLAISTLLNSMITSAQQAGGQILEQQSVMLGGQYPASVALVSISSQKAKGYIGVFQAGGNIVEFSLGASPESSFDNNQQMLIAMIDSIRVPAESGSSLAPTAVPLNQQPDNPVGGSSAAFSFKLPEGWSEQPMNMPNFSDVRAFGSTDAAAQGIINLFTNGEQPENFDGVGGFIGAVETQQLQGQTPDALVSPLMQSILTNIQNDAVTIIESPAAHTFGGQYAGELTLTSLGYIAVMYSGQQLLVSVILSSDLDTNRDAMSGILESVRIPAEGAPPATVEAAPSNEGTSAAPQTVRSSDQHVSLSLPTNWVVLDHSAANILAYGDSSAAAQSRLYSARPDLTTSAAISGNGGLIILYPMSQFGINPQNPDPGPLMQRALGNLQGYTVEQAAQPLEGGGLYAIISGTERGYLALIPFGDQIAYVTATGTSDSFADNQPALLNILKSVRVPAAPEDSGLGGLGGLDLEATPEPTAPGLSGL